MAITRRELIVLGSAGLVLVGCGSSSPGGDGGAAVARPARPARVPVDAGPLADYAAEGIYGRFRASHGFFVVRAGGRLFAMSAICTHRDCLVSPAAADGGLRCRCHGSTFTPHGHVTRGPARRDLPRYAVERDARDHLIVHLERPLTPDEFDRPASFLYV